MQTAESEGDYRLMKFTQFEYANDLMLHGTVFMQPLSVFPKVKDPVIGDPNEGLWKRYTAENPSFQSFKINTGGKDIEVPIRELRLNSTERRHGVYCMRWMSVREPLEPVLMFFANDKRMQRFGDAAVVFRDSSEFVRRMFLAARTAGYELDSRPMEYFPTAHCGPMNAFRKLATYSYQNEWRFLTDKPIGDQPLVLKLGSLIDVAQCFRVKR